MRKSSDFEGNAEIRLNNTVEQNAENQRMGFSKWLFSLLLGFLLTVVTLTYCWCLFINAMQSGFVSTTQGFFGSGWVSDLLNSWFPIFLGAFLDIIVLTFLIVLHKKRIRRFFLFAGFFTILTAVLDFIFGIIALWLLPFFSADWQNAFVNSTVAFRAFSIIVALLLLVVGVTFLSIYFCISAAKRSAS